MSPVRLGLLFLCAALAVLPMAWALWAALAQAADGPAWQALLDHPQTRSAWHMTLWTGLASTVLAWITTARLLAWGWMARTLTRSLRLLPAFLATPHAAVAIALVLWLAPSGWALRSISPGLTGLTSPPAWPTTQDPWGLGMILALWLKEVPFLLWIAATQWQRDDLRRQSQAEFALAQTLGHPPRRAWAQVVWPPLAQHLRWPLLAVLAYGLTVVDVALIIGPATPPTLAVLAWQWLGDADPALQAQGAAAAGLLTLTVVALAAVLGSPLCLRQGWTRATGALAQMGAIKAPAYRLGLSGLGLLLAYAALWWALAVGSVSGLWPFPHFWPTQWTAQAWLQVKGSSATLITSAVLALVSASLCLVWCVAWLELAPRRLQHLLRPALLLPLVIPALLWVIGLYAIALQLRLEGQWSGLVLAHTLMVLPYVLLALEPAYQSVDARQAAVVASLGHGPWRALWSVKWPLLRQALASAWAVGFAVSVAQYLPTLYVGAGRVATVTTEAVTLAAGSQRTLMSAYAALQMLLPILMFALAAWVGRARRFQGAVA